MNFLVTAILMRSLRAAGGTGLMDAIGPRVVRLWSLELAGG